MRQYVFLGSLLPDLRIGVPPEMSFEELMPYLENNLSSEGLSQLRTLLLLQDLYHLRTFWRGEELGSRGNFNENELEEAILTQTGFPNYVYQFIEHYESNEERVDNFSELLSQYFSQEIALSSGFLKKLLIFERETRLILTALRAKKFSKDILKELQFEDPYDVLVAEILAQKDAHSYEPPEAYKDLKQIFEDHEDDPLKLQEAIIEWKFNRIQDMQGIDIFSLDRILSYIERLILVEQWLELDKQKGLQIVDNILKEAT
jgi:hypothetical protein